MSKTKEKVVPIISRSLEDADIPGVQIEITPEEADEYGAFEETALTEEEAWESNSDLNRIIE